MRKGTWIGLVAAVGLIAPVALGQAVVDDFEGYTTGGLAGQGLWTLNAGSGTASVINTDNGPSIAGGQALYMNNYSDQIALDLGFVSELVATYGQYITVQYDVKVPSDTYTTGSMRFDIRLMDNEVGRPPVWNTHIGAERGLDNRDAGALYPGDVNASWYGADEEGPFWFHGDWHTVSHTFYYGGTAPNLVKIGFDGTDHARHFHYAMTPWADSADRLYVRVRGGNDNNDELILDNIQIFAGDPPSAAPTADAGADQTGLPGSWDGTLVDVDASDSSDDVGIVTYRWSMGGAVLAETADPQTQILLGPGTHDVWLTVVDGDGLQGADNMTIQVDPAPAIIDNVQTDGGILYMDIFGTSASDEIPVIFDEDTEMEVLNETVTGDGAGNYSTMLFDARGNVYYVTWWGGVRSYTADLTLRWTSEDTGYVGEENTTLIVGERYVYIANRSDPDQLPRVYAFDKLTGATVWTCDLLVSGSPVETPDFKPRMVLYEDKLYVTGQVGVEQADYCRIYQVNATTGVLDVANLVFTGLKNEPNTAGNLVLIPDAFGIGEHGLYWNRNSGGWDAGGDTIADITAIKVNPVAGTAQGMWNNPWTANGPYLWRSHVMYSDPAGRMYTPSYWDWGFSLYVWDPTDTTGTQLVDTVIRDLGGNHGHADAQALENFEPGVTKVHAHSNAGEMVTYIDDGVNPITVEKRTFDIGDGSHYSHTATALYDDINDRAVIVTGIKNEWPARVIGIDLSAAPVVPDDGEAIIDDIKIYGTNDLGGAWTLLHEYDFDDLAIGLLNGQPYGPGYADGNWTAYSSEYDPDNVNPIQVVDTAPYGKAGKGVLLDPFGPEGGVWFEGWPFTSQVTPGEYTYMVFEWYQYRVDLTDQLRCYAPTEIPGYSVEGAYANDSGDGLISALTYDGPYAQTAAGAFEKVDRIFEFNGFNTNIRILVNDAEVDPGTPDAVVTTPGYGYNYIDFSMDGTVNSTSGGAEFLMEWVDPEPGEEGNEWLWGERGPSVGPDGTVYFFLYRSYDRRFIRIGAPDQLAPGDMDCDGDVDFDDINPFVLALSGEAAYLAQYPDCVWLNGDCDGDGDVDFDDINPFVALIGTTYP